MDRSSAYVQDLCIREQDLKYTKVFTYAYNSRQLSRIQNLFSFPQKFSDVQTLEKLEGEGGEEPGSIRATTSVRGRKRQGQDADRNGIWERGSKRSPSLIHIGGIAKLRLVVRGGSLAMA